jgi:tetratricopeptide (TPR) repeat protein
VKADAKPADPLSGLVGAEKAYAEAYLRKGRPPFLHVDDRRPLSALQDGDCGILSIQVPAAEVRQVAGGREFLACGLGEAGREQGVFWVEGVNTAGLVDGEVISLEKVPLAVAGTKRYVTAAGSTKTVKRFVALDAARVEKVVRPEIERRAREEAERAAAGEKELAAGRAKKAADEAARKAALKKTEAAAESAAETALREALDLLAYKGTRERGLRALEAVNRAYPETTAAWEARRVLDAAAAKERALRRPDPRAESYLRYARKLLDEGMTEKARERLKEIVETCPPSSTREEAREVLKRLEENIRK